MDFRAAFLVLTVLSGVDASLKGKLTSCEEEGASVQPPLGTDACIRCRCQDRTVRCWKPKCSATEGCYVLSPEKPEHSCCRLCRGCGVGERVMVSGETFVDASDVTHHCLGAVLTRAPLRCHVPCSRPTQYINRHHGDKNDIHHVNGTLGAGLHGNCPLCPADDKTANGGCFHGDAFVADGDRVQWREDKCITCTCVSGQLSCVKRACPVLNCPESRIQRDGSACCPRCEGSREEAYPENGSCVFRGQVLYEGTASLPDKCTSCTCRAGTTVCEREVCPALRCPAHAVQHQKGECCPTCKEARPCSDKEGTARTHAETWRVDTCTTCECYSGTVDCQTMTCDSKPCPSSMIKAKSADKCCSVCVEASSRCSLTESGSETLQISTFDRKLYRFAGACKYVLVEAENKFSVFVKNMYATPSTFAVKRVEAVLKTADNSLTTVSMDTDLMVTVNGTVVSNGDKVEGLLRLEGKAGAVTLTLMLETVTLTLTEEGTVEVSAPREMRGALRGLCGDYDENAADDMTSRDGRQTTDTETFVHSWRMNKCSCDRKVPESERHSACSLRPERRSLAKSSCDVIRRRPFKTCGQSMSLRPYYLTCLDNVCSCQENPQSSKCQCPVINTLVVDCEKLGLEIKEVTDCRPRLQHEAKFVDSRLTLALKNGGEQHRKGKKSRKSRKSRKPKNQKRQKQQQSDLAVHRDALNGLELEKMKNELTKKHAKKPDANKPRGPDAFLLG